MRVVHDLTTTDGERGFTFHLLFEREARDVVIHWRILSMSNFHRIFHHLLLVTALILLIVFWWLNIRGVVLIILLWIDRLSEGLIFRVFMNRLRSLVRDQLLESRIVFVDNINVL